MNNTMRLLGCMALAASLAFAACADSGGDRPIVLSGGAAGDAVVSINAIPGVVVPVRGETPVVTPIETAQYTGIVTWSPADSPFKPETAYTAYIALTAKSGFTLTGVPENFFTVAGADSVANSADSSIVSAVFPATGASEDIDVTFQSATQTGGTPCTADSTGLLLLFDKKPGTLTADNITVTGATKGILSSQGAFMYLAISNINVANEGTVDVTITNPSGYSISGSPKTAVVYRITAANMIIGMDYRGGKLAYILQSGDLGYDANVPHGLIAATADADQGSVIWGPMGLNGNTSETLGTGLANSNAIIAQVEAAGIYWDPTWYAAGCARTYNAGGYTDWFLPSKDELDKLYINHNAIGGFATNMNYWSSSEYDAFYPWIQYFDDGEQSCSVYSKPSYGRVRAVRSF